VNESSYLGALVISAWWHDGSLVARFTARRGLDGPIEDLGVAAGTGDIVAKLSDWLQNAARERSQGQE
jgi:hypothetical protein